MDEKHLIVIFMILAIVGLSMGFMLLNNWIRAKYISPLEDDQGLGSNSGEREKIERLEAENRELNDTLGTMQERMVVLEKIVTDRGYSLSEEIEALRDNPVRDVPAQDDSGVPLNISQKEKA